jgi:hypothetical protein
MMILSSSGLKINNQHYRFVLRKCLLSGFLITTVAHAEPADVLNVEVNNQGETRYTFKVTVQHADTGWDHYADAWVIFTEDGEYLASRNLQHPHIKEQPFTRSLPNLPVSEAITNVVIRAHCSRDGFVGKEITVQLR